MASTLTSLFGLTALLLAAIGLYRRDVVRGHRRTRENRRPHGFSAGRRDVLRLVLYKDSCLTSLGIALGLSRRCCSRA